MPIAFATDFHLESPPQLVRGDRREAVGSTVYVALLLLIELDGRAPIAGVCRTVWGREDVLRRTLWSLCHRANEKLQAVGSALRVAVDGSDVVLL